MDSQNLDSRYRGQSGSKYQTSKHKISRKAFDYVAKMRAQKFARWIDRHDSILEFGVGNGWNLEHLDCRVKSGYDVCPKPEKFIPSIHFFNNLGQLYEKYDKIICHHVLEHTENPVMMLNDMKNAVKDDGVIILFVPLEEDRRYKKFSASDSDHHLFSWNAQSLGNLLDSQGLTVLEYGFYYTGFDRFVAELAIKLKFNFLMYFFFLKIIRSLFRKKEIYFIVKKSR